MRRVNSCLGAAAIVAPAAANATTDCGGGIWAYPDCTSPAIIVSNAQDVIDVTFGGGNITIDVIGTPSFGADVGILIAAGTGAGAQNIGAVMVTSSTGVTSYVALTFAVSATSDFINNVAAINFNENSALSGLAVAGQIQGNLGDVDVTRLGTIGVNTGLDVLSDVTGNLLFRETSGGPDLPSNLSVSGEVDGGVSIVAESGIGTLDVEGSIGEEGDPAAIVSGRDITEIIAGDLYADIEASHLVGPSLVYSNIRRIRVTDDNGGGGDFVGTIHANTIGDPKDRLLEAGVGGLPQIIVEGNWGSSTTPSILTLEAPLAETDPSVSVILVDGGFLAGSEFNLPEDGLEGQIIFSRVVGAGWETGAEIVIDGSPDIVLGGTTYDAAASEIGGGSAGLGQFRLHRQSCDPPAIVEGESGYYGELAIEGSLEINGTEIECVYDRFVPVGLRFYGPIEVSDPETSGDIKVERYAHPFWIDVTDDYLVDHSSEDRRVAIVSPDPGGDGWAAGSFRMTRVDGGLLCAEVAGAPDVSRFTYYLDVYVNDCGEMLLGGFDLNSDQNLTSGGDVPAWAAGPEDLNADSAIDSGDLATLDSAIGLWQAAPIYFPGPHVDVE